MTTASPVSSQLTSKLRQLPEPAGPSETARGWDAFSREEWPDLFRLIDLGAAAPRDLAAKLLAPLPHGVWPELENSLRDLVALQKLVDHPAIPVNCKTIEACDDLTQAALELEERHCTHVSFLLDRDQRQRLDRLVAELSQEKKDFWGQLERSQYPELFALFDEALGSKDFFKLTGFELERDEYSLTLSLQDLQSAGIGWHRDLYWPEEWVGEDVFPVLYGLDDDSPEKGGAFLFYVPWENQLYAFFRQSHEATVMWNSRENDGRILHAVSGYRGVNTSRHLIILQCLRRDS